MQIEEVKRVAASALQAALQEEPEPSPDPPRGGASHRLQGAGAVAVGAALVTAARVGKKHLPRLRKLRLLKHGLGALDEASKLEDFTGALRDRFADRGHQDESDPEGHQGLSDSQDYESEEYEGEDRDEDEGEDRGEDENWPPEQGGENGARGETPDLVAALSAPQSPPPMMERMAEGLNPAARPPRAVERGAGRRRSQSRDGARSGSNRKKQSTAG